jgi:NAD+ synthase (glutamine-hydrolysing)
MRLIRIAIANVNTTVGALRSNVDRAIALARAAAADRATICAFPEQLISGYPPEDLVQWRAFVDQQWTELERFARETSVLPGAFVVGVTVARAPGVFNCAALVHRGRILGLVPKEKLPTYNVFYEGRTFARGAAGLFDAHRGVPFGDLVFDFDFGSVGLEVCEDMWSPDGPMRRRCYAGAEVMINLSASPYRLGMVDTRREVICTRSGDNQAVMAYAALVGANDGLVFDGGGYVAQNGRLIHDAPRFREGVSAVNVDLDRTRRLRLENTTWRTDQEAYVHGGGLLPHHITIERASEREGLAFPAPLNRSFFLPPESPRRSPKEAFCEDLLDALALGIGDYFEKIGAFKTIGVALSGGRDSLLVLLLARRYVDRRFADLDYEGRAAKAKELLRAFYMPSKFSSEATRRAAEVAAADVNAPFAVVSVDEAVETELRACEAMLQPGETVTQMTRQNAQARVRAERMWNWSNSAGGLFLQTSNMSEKAVGYTTIGGDMEGALAVVANLPKTVVNYLLDYLFEKTGMKGIELTLAFPASAELAEDQEDEKELMPFPVLDACFALYAGEKMTPDEVALALRSVFPDEDPIKLDAWCARFARLFTQSIYKWVQTALSLHVGNLDLERERALQLPVVQRTEWQKR